MAALYVVAYHFFEGATGAGVLNDLVRHGYIAVDLFFILSGFVLMKNYADRFRYNVRWGNYGAFLYKRFARIYPLYAFCLTIKLSAIDAGVLSQPAPTLVQVGSNLLLAQAWGVANSIVGPSWSISTEVFAYLVFPFAAWCLFRLKGFASVAIPAALLVLAYIVNRSLAELHEATRTGGLDIYNGETFFPLLRCCCGFAIGMSLEPLSRIEPLRRAVGRFDTLFCVLAAALTVLPVSDLVRVGAYALVVLSLSWQRPSATTSALASVPVHWLGLVSYSIYLNHRLIEGLVRGRFQQVLERGHVSHAYSVAGILTGVLVLVASAATFRWIERPARSTLRRFAGFRRRPIGSEASAP